jgi:hypothetical protein
MPEWVFCYWSFVDMSGYFGTDPLWTWVKDYDCCDPSSAGTLTRVNSLEYVCWACFATNYTYAIYIGNIFLLLRTYRTTCCHGIISSYCIQKWVLRIFNLTKATTKRTTLSHPLAWLNRKSCHEIPLTFNSRKSLVLSQNLEFNHLLESLGSYLQLWYFEFPQFALGFRLKPQISQVSLFCPETGILATPSTFRDHYAWIISRIEAYG